MDIDIQKDWISVLSSDFFVRHICDSGDHRIIPVLLKCNKMMRARLQIYLSDHLRDMFREARYYNYGAPVDVRRRAITGLFRTGTLKYFLQYLDTTWERVYLNDLAAIPPELARDWPRCYEYLTRLPRFTANIAGDHRGSKLGCINILFVV